MKAVGEKGGGGKEDSLQISFEKEEKSYMAHEKNETETVNPRRVMRDQKKEGGESKHGPNREIKRKSNVDAASQKRR